MSMTRIASLVGGILGATSLVSVASATAYVDEGAWRAAVSNVYALETWDTGGTPAGSDVGSMPGLGIRFLPLNDGTLPTVQPYASTGGVVKSGPNNLLNDRDFSLPARGPINVVPLAAGDFLYGLGLWNVGGDDQLRLSFYGAGDVLIEEVTSAVSSGFFGIVNSAGAVRAQVSFVQGNGYAPTDDWQTAARAVFIPPGQGGVPEPSTWAMMLLGFGGMGAMLRTARRRKAALA
jgi:hypothetical protein